MTRAEALLMMRAAARAMSAPDMAEEQIAAIIAPRVARGRAVLAQLLLLGNY